MGFFEGFGIGGLLDAGTNIFNAISQSRQYKYQRDLNNLLMQREDTAVQRRMKDLAAAGLNPLLAGSQSASTMGLSAGNAPQMTTGLFSEAENRGIKKAQQKKDFEAIDASIDKLNEEVQNLAEQNKVIQAQREKYELENSILRGQIKQYDEAGFYPSSTFGKMYFDLLNASPDFRKNIEKLFPQLLPEVVQAFSEDSDFSNAVSKASDAGAKSFNDLKVALNPVDSKYRESFKTNKNLANTLNKAFGDLGFHVTYSDGLFRVDDRSDRYDNRYETFLTYQEVKKYIDSRR